MQTGCIMSKTEKAGDFNMDCLFCKIVNGEIPSKVVYQDSKIIAFHDISPAAPVHILVIPKTHIASAADIRPVHSSLLAHLWSKIPQIAKEHGLSQFRVVTNSGEDAGQTVAHLHFHILGGHKLQGFFG